MANNSVGYPRSYGITTVPVAASPKWRGALPGEEEPEPVLTPVRSQRRPVFQRGPNSAGLVTPPRPGAVGGPGYMTPGGPVAVGGPDYMTPGGPVAVGGPAYGTPSAAATLSESGPAPAYHPMAMRMGIANPKGDPAKTRKPIVVKNRPYNPNLNETRVLGAFNPGGWSWVERNGEKEFMNTRKQRKRRRGSRRNRRTHRRTSRH